MKRSIMAGVLIAGMSLFLLAGNANAGNTRDPLIQDRIATLQKRIAHGVANGDLTRAEAKRVQKRLNRIRRQEARLKADGRLTTAERARLHRELDKERALIYRKKHNVRRRY